MDTPESLPHQIDQYEAWQRETIRRHGWALQAVLGDEESPPFVYTVGLAGFRHPELILFATTQATAAAVLNELGELVRAGRWLAPLERVELSTGAVHLLAFPESEHWLFAANDLYRTPGTPPVPRCSSCPTGSWPSYRARTSRARSARELARATRLGRGRRAGAPRRASRSRPPRPR